MLPFSSLQQESVDKKGWGSRNTRPPVSPSHGDALSRIWIYRHYGNEKRNKLLVLQAAIVK